MVDEQRVRRLLRALAEELHFLDLESRATAERRADLAVRKGIRYSLAAAVEACIDIAHHLCASEAWGPVNTNAQTMAVLARHGVLSAALARAMGAAVGFRNILIHGYAEVDESIVDARLADHQDLHDFAVAVSSWLTSRSESEGR